MRDPAAVRLLRQLALHRETAALLEMRAARSASPAEAEGLRRRAAQRREVANQLWQQLTRAGLLTVRGAPSIDRAPNVASIRDANR